MRSYYSLLLFAGTLLAPTVPAPAQETIILRYGTHDRPFEGQRYDTMRSLAHYLDVVASNAAAQAVGDQNRSDKSREFVKSVESFSEKARDFHKRMDRYKDSPWEVPEEVDKLNHEAQEVSQKLRRARVLENTWDDWDSVLDVLGRMNRAIAGQHVEVPQPHD